MTERRTERRVVTFKADEELVERIDVLAHRLGLHRSEIIRAAVVFFINYIESANAPVEELRKFIEVLAHGRLYLLRSSGAMHGRCCRD